VTVVELTHGIYRGKTDLDQASRSAFAEEIYRDIIVYPVTLEIATLAGKIEGEQMARGISIAFQDLLIGTTALQLDFEVVTLNVRHFQKIPGLRVVLPAS
jgi:tRNA(fMet)-specific endonuclease VapC